MSREHGFWRVPFQISGASYCSLVRGKWWHYYASSVTLLEISKWPVLACLAPNLNYLLLHKNLLAPKRDAKSCVRRPHVPGLNTFMCGEDVCGGHFCLNSCLLLQSYKQYEQPIQLLSV
ncbi:unnamed protein product [Sphenostylis stenocarpa]|uniref:Uncharacterized protein n=1 Tax=Sphenostylis stenocarpa TaxID=92480 RepID=A0AA86VVM6_9FABA|nr:unnamed protein product [Sphenostylis stenocarpa]